MAANTPALPVCRLPPYWGIKIKRGSYYLRYMKWQLFQRISSTFLLGVFLLLAIRNFKKDPSDNISLFTIIFFTALISAVITSAVIKYVAQRRNYP